MSNAKRSLRLEKLARIYDDEIAPIWGSLFGRLLTRGLEIPAKGQVLDVACGTGNPTVELLRCLPSDGRLIAIDSSSAMLDAARHKVARLGPLGGKGVFFRTESFTPRLSFADDVYDLVVCNLGLGDPSGLAAAMADFARVTKPGGEVRCTLPMAGTFAQLHDIYREVLIKYDKHEALARLERHIASYPTTEDVERCLEAAELSGGVDVDEVTLLFRSSREFFFAPVIEYGPLDDWKQIAGTGQDMQDVFWYIKEAIDSYFSPGPFPVTIRAGCVSGRKGYVTQPHPRVADEFAWGAQPELPERPNQIASGSVRLADLAIEADPHRPTVAADDPVIAAVPPVGEKRSAEQTTDGFPRDNLVDSQVDDFDS